MLSTEQMSAGQLRWLYSHKDVITSMSSLDVSGSRFVTTSLDGVVKLYDLEKCEVSTVLKVTPILDSVFADENLYISCVDGSIRCVDFEANTLRIIGEPHLKGLSCVVAAKGKIISGGWDKRVQLLDLVTHRSEFIDLPQKVIALDCMKDTLVVAMTDRKVYVYDLKKLSRPLQIRESGLKHQIRSVSCFKEGFVLSGIEGKASVEYYDNKSNYAFRCHRDEDVVNSVNCCLVRDDHTLYTSGDDGSIMEWNYVEKKKKKEYFCVNGRISKFLISTTSDRDRVVVASNHEVYMRDI